MKIIETEIEDLLILEPTIYGDDRGYFFESYNAARLKELGINIDFIQDNEAKSTKNIWRGFHYQLPPFAQTKLVRVIQGSVLDIVIDIRPSSKTYGQVYAVELSAINKLQLLVPQGLAHGYLSLEDDTIFAYKVDQFYSRDHERGISFQDPELKIEWPLDIHSFITSEKDKVMPNFESHTPYE